LQYVGKKVATYEANKKIVEKVLQGETVTPEQQKFMTELEMQTFKDKGTKHFIEILKNEFKDTPLAVKVSVKGKSKDLSGRTDKLVNIFRQIIVNPAVLQIPAIGKIFNDILESSGLEPADFSGITDEQVQKTLPQGAPQQMMDNMTANG